MNTHIHVYTKKCVRVYFKDIYSTLFIYKFRELTSSEKPTPRYEINRRTNIEGRNNRNTKRMRYILKKEHLVIVRALYEHVVSSIDLLTLPTNISKRYMEQYLQRKISCRFK